MKIFWFATIVALGVLVMPKTAAAKDSPKEKETAKAESAEAVKDPLNVEMETLEGKKINLAKKYKGKVVLLVNVASKCGYTKQYKPLEALHEKYAKKGLAIVGVPCNQFGKQEPGTSEEIADFCEKNYGVKFDMLGKVDVNGKDAAPLYKTLTSEKANPGFDGKIGWNFEKFLFDRDGKVVARFKSKVEPDSDEMIEAIEAQLAKK
jgi:glutathione peroxidase